MRQLLLVCFLTFVAASSFGQTPWPSASVPSGFLGFPVSQARDLATDLNNCTIVAQWKTNSDPLAPQLQLRIYDGSSWITDNSLPVVPHHDFASEGVPPNGGENFSVGRVDINLRPSDGGVGIAFNYTWVYKYKVPGTSYKWRFVTRPYVGYVEENGGGWDLFVHCIADEIPPLPDARNISDIQIEDEFGVFVLRTNGWGTVSFDFDDFDTPVIGYCYNYNSVADGLIEEPVDVPTANVVIQQGFPTSPPVLALDFPPTNPCTTTAALNIQDVIAGRVYDIDAARQESTGDVFIGFTYIFGRISLVNGSPGQECSIASVLPDSQNPPNRNPARYVRIASDTDGDLGVAFNRSNIFGDPQGSPPLSLTQLEYFEMDGATLTAGTVDPPLYEAVVYASAPTVGDLYIHTGDHKPRVVASHDPVHLHYYGKKLYYYWKNATNNNWYFGEPTAAPAGGTVRTRMTPDPCFQAAIILGEGKIWAGYAFLLGGGCDSLCPP